MKPRMLSRKPSAKNWKPMNGAIRRKCAPTSPAPIIAIARMASKNASHAKVIRLSPERDLRSDCLIPHSPYHKLRQYEQKRSARDTAIDLAEPSFDLGVGDLAGVARVPRETRFQHR